ncbi:MAG: cytochrome c oxidase accessory protein CcoG [Flectobacillus sp.]|nr:cytochrome c oxidase accessory protein CcoG [Flectobacillus sp.]
MKPEQIDTTEFRDHLSNVTEAGKRIWIYPRIIKGLLYKYRTVFSWFLMLLLFGLPWIEIDGHPYFMFNVIERKFIFFGVMFFPQDFHLVAIGLLTFIVFIILFTVIFGRVWCGWACPQTIFMEMLFRKIENWIEGDYKAQQRLDASPWTQEKILKKTAKHTIFFVLSFIIANTFLAYLIGKQELWTIVSDDPSRHVGSLASMILFTSVFYFVFARFRELVCIVVCPYGRLQGVLLDKKSIVVAYDYVRGEPRGKQTKVVAEIPKGDCIDCKICVQVCPTGIDIRNGTQLECIGCTACIDACDEVMVKIDKPIGLIRYDSLDGIENKTKLKFNLRIKAYSAVLAALLGVLVYLLLSRNMMETTILRTPGLTYQENKNGTVSNLYSVEVMNKSTTSMPVNFALKDFPKGKIKLIGKPLFLNAGELTKGSFFIEIPKKDLPDNTFKLEVEVYSNGKLIDHVKTSFLGPME